ncbi:MAG TPA: putative leader peptide [Pseudonocardia sp.]|nr:putative leader peptide [Pseudonocardia sp.]
MSRIQGGPGALLVRRQHVDLRRTASAICSHPPLNIPLAAHPSTERTPD